MNIALLINNPIFYLTIIVVIFFSSLAVLGLIKTKPRELSNREKLGISLILFGETIAIGFVLFFTWSISRESILWAIQNHENLSTTTGKITESMTKWSGSPAHNAYGLHFQIRYEYKVNNVLYKSDRVNYGYKGSSDESLAEKYVKKYPVGKSVIVYYDPLDPKKSVLEPNVILYMISVTLLQMRVRI